MAYYILFQRDSERIARLEDVIERRLRAEPAEITSISTIAGKVGTSYVLSPSPDCISSSSTRNHLGNF